MNTLSARILVLSSLALLGACTAQQASVTDPLPSEEDAVLDDAYMPRNDGPYLEEDGSPADDSVELHLNASSSSIQP